MLQRLPENARVAVIRLRSLGDCVLTTPALSILKNARPDLRIAVAVEPRFAAIFEGNPAVSQLLDPSLTDDLPLSPSSLPEPAWRNAKHVDDRGFVGTPSGRLRASQRFLDL